MLPNSENWISKLPKESKGLFINGLCGTGRKARGVITIGDSVHISVSEVPTARQRANQFETFGFKWIVFEGGD